MPSPSEHAHRSPSLSHHPSPVPYNATIKPKPATAPAIHVPTRRTGAAAPSLFRLGAAVVVCAGTLTTAVYVDVVGPLGPLNVSTLVKVDGDGLAEAGTVVTKTEVTL